MLNKKAKINLHNNIIKALLFKIVKLSLPILLFVLMIQPNLISSGTVYAFAATPRTKSTSSSSSSTPISTPTPTTYQCGTGSEKQTTSIDFGCKGDACVAGGTVPNYCSQNNSPIIDLLFSLIRFLSDGVGLVIVGSIIFAGIQYTTAGGDPQNVAKAIKRIRSSITALIFFIFIYAILNYLIPAGFFKS